MALMHRWKTDSSAFQRLDAARHPVRVLLAEHDEDMRNLLVDALWRHGYEVTDFADGSQLLYYLDQLEGLRELRQIGVIISDIRMPGFTSLEVLAGLRISADAPPMILITGFDDAEAHLRATRLGAATMIDNPLDVDALLAKVREVTG